MKAHEKQTHEPLFHVVKRVPLPIYKSITIRVIAVAAALLLCSLLSIFLIGM